MTDNILKNHIDLEGYGNGIVAQKNGVFSNGGYIHYLGKNDDAKALLKRIKNKIE